MSVIAVLDALNSYTLFSQEHFLLSITLRINNPFDKVISSLCWLNLNDFPQTFYIYPIVVTFETPFILSIFWAIINFHFCYNAAFLILLRHIVLVIFICCQFSALVKLVDFSYMTRVLVLNARASKNSLP